MPAIRNFFRNEKILFLEFYENFDVLTFNETNLYEDKLPNVKSGYYVNKPVVADYEKIVPLHPNPDSENLNGEFQFIKIEECKGFQQTKIIANVYRSPSRKM